MIGILTLRQNSPTALHDMLDYSNLNNCVFLGLIIDISPQYSRFPRSIIKDQVSSKIGNYFIGSPIRCVNNTIRMLGFWLPGTLTSHCSLY